jgi:hypothetical protein
MTATTLAGDSSLGRTHYRELEALVRHPLPEGRPTGCSMVQAAVPCGATVPVLPKQCSVPASRFVATCPAAWVLRSAPRAFCVS